MIEGLDMADQTIRKLDQSQIGRILTDDHVRRERYLRERHWDGPFCCSACSPQAI